MACRIWNKNNKPIVRHEIKNKISIRSTELIISLQILHFLQTALASTILHVFCFFQCLIPLILQMSSALSNMTFLIFFLWISPSHMCLVVVSSFIFFIWPTYLNVLHQDCLFTFVLFGINVPTLSSFLIC